MQDMTLNYTVKARQFMKEHDECCSICGKKFNNGDTCHLGYDSKNKLIYIGDCCVSKLLSTIARHYHVKKPYIRPPQDAILWRFMDFTKFASLLHTGSLYFARADKFDDPFEGAKGLLKNKKQFEKFYLDFAMNAYKTLPDGSNRFKSKDALLGASKKVVEMILDAGERATKHTFINCWHENNFESEAMWKLYTLSLEQGIAIKTTHNKLYRSLGRNPDISIGRVNYIDYSKTFVDVNSCFWYKRKSFEHEREVRAIASDIPSSNAHGLLMPVDLSVLIDRVYVSPQSEGWYKELVIDVMAKYNVKKRVLISDMNDTPFH